MLKEYFMGGLSFLGKVSLDSCPKGGSFSQGVYSQFLCTPFFISHKSPVPSPLQPKLDQRDLQCFLGQTRHEYQKVHSF